MMAQSLRSIQKLGQRASEMRSAVTYAVAYPSFMMILVSGVLWMFGVNLIQNMRKTAPPKIMASMSDVAAVSDFIEAWGIFVLIGIVLFICFIVWTLPRWQGKMRSKFDMFPPWSWYRALQGSSFLLGLSALLSAQVPLKRALEILEDTDNKWMKERVFSARQEVLRGRNLGEALRVGGYNFPDPAVAIDLEILAERSDVGSVIEDVTDEWIEDQIDSLKQQAAVARNLGLVAVGGTIAWAMQSVFAVVTKVSESGGM
jgi:type II secretory pathway component PulF